MNDTGPEDKACCWREQPMQNNNASNWFVPNTRALGINEIMNKITSPKGVLMRTGLITTTSPFLFILFICIPTKKNYKHDTRTAIRLNDKTLCRNSRRSVRWSEFSTK